MIVMVSKDFPEVLAPRILVQTSTMGASQTLSISATRSKFSESFLVAVIRLPIFLAVTKQVIIFFFFT